jgi:YesN/AraC family two-component response regulator
MQTVLIADNDAAVRRLLRWTITAGDRVVLEAADGDATWDLMHQARPDIVCSTADSKAEVATPSPARSRPT